MCFEFHHAPPPPPSPLIVELNVLFGKLGHTTVQQAASQRKILLSQDQEKVLQFLNITKSPLLVIRALAGTGKSTLAGIVLDVYLRDMPHGEAVVILVPSRTLRDEHALNADLGVPQILGDVGKGPMCSRVLWLGRAAEDAQIKTWDDQIFEATQDMLAKPLARLKERWPYRDNGPRLIWN